jgi:hypothetical protein
LCCFLFCWLLRGVGEKRDAVPDVELPRCWPKKLAVAIEAGWLWAGETGTEDAEALDEDAAGGGLVDMAPSQGSTMRRGRRHFRDDGRRVARQWAARQDGTERWERE